MIDTPGHTPGHLSVLVEGGEGLIIGADVAPNEVVSLRHPDWAFGFDADPEQAIATRKALLDRAATDGTLYLGFHFTYPGVGRIERDGGGFRFVADLNGGGRTLPAAGATHRLGTDSQTGRP